MRIVKYKIELVKESSSNYITEEKIINPFIIKDILNGIFHLNRYTEEVLMLICLDNKHKIIGVHEVSRGSLNSSMVHPREIFKRAIVNNASKIVLAHNHPSEDIQPSNEDKNITRRIENSGDLLGISLMDHIIVGGDEYYSFRENGLI